VGLDWEHTLRKARLIMVYPKILLLTLRVSPDRPFCAEKRALSLKIQLIRKGNGYKAPPLEKGGTCIIIDHEAMFEYHKTYVYFRYNPCQLTLWMSIRCVAGTTSVSAQATLDMVPRKWPWPM